jgi:hypothetical protein
MPKPNKQAKRPRDVNQWARQIVEESTHLDEIAPPEAAEPIPPSTAQISAYMAKMGSKGGKIGGKRRLETMSARKRSAIARKAAESRWKSR